MSTSAAAAKQIIVVGSGLAGLTSAYTALSNGVKVTILEMESKFGGNSMKASSGINGAPTKYQPEPDNLFYQDTVKSAGAIYANSDIKPQREALMKTLVDNSKDAVYFLSDTIGVDLSLVAQLGGHSKPRTHRGAGKTPPGFAIISALLKKIENDFSELATLKKECRVTKLLTESGVVVGVEYQDLANADAKPTQLFGPVVMAAGGFAGDTTGLVEKYRPDLAGFPSTNSPRKQSLSLLTAIGAQLIDMESIQVHPTGFVDLASPGSKVKFLAAEALRGHGGILVDPKGDRFVNEVLRRDEVTDAVFEKCPSTSVVSSVGNDGEIKQWESWLVMDEGSVEAIKSNVGFYMFKKLMYKSKLSELASTLPNIKSSLIKYSQSVKDKKDTEFGRHYYGSWNLNPDEISDDTEIYYGKVTPVLHFTMGGAKFNEHAEFVNEQDKPIDGIWGCGEITAGVHSSNRLGGSSLLECVVFGRIAGERASKALTGKL
ncbi:unnamed protein product [Ambrosiozyma monospora]|uniref:Fumarate reductase n=2 Tax=Ambrosiozyma monospora TaxID=43982 RepID=A0A9W6YVF4_AMBMO|nr:unnamed protein product [Ambrosiozyma monospora]